MAKARDAFRTISEVSDWLDTPAHVLRFWESKFTQVKPVKRAGGRRYYRPEDMALLGGIKTLLHDQGMTIKGAQKMLREQGVKEIAALSPDVTDADNPQKKPMPQVAKNKPISAAPAHKEAPEEPPKAALKSVPDPVPEDTADDAPTPAQRPLTRRPQPQLAEDQTPPENVVPLTKMPPSTAQPTLVETKSIPKSDTAEPLLPRETPTPAEPRIFAALRDANTDHIRKRAAQIAPLLARLEDVRDRMRQT